MIEGGEGGTAYSPKNNDIDFVEELQNLKETPFAFKFKNGLPQDYFNNDLAWPIFSENFKSLIIPFLPKESSWIKTIIDVFDHKHIAYILKINKKYDVLDKDKTIFASGTDFVVKAVLSGKKSKGDECFLCARLRTFTYCLSEGKIHN